PEEGKVGGGDAHRLNLAPVATAAAIEGAEAAFLGATAPHRNRSTMGAASFSRSYPLPPMIQEVTISSRAPKNALVVTLVLRSARNDPSRCPCSITSVMSTK